MRRIGGHVSSAGGPVNGLKQAKAIGANALQIFAGSPRTWARSIYTPKQVSDYLDYQKQSEIAPLFIHALYLINLGTDNPDLLEKSKQSLLTDLKNADLLGAEGVVVHTGSHQGRGLETSLNQIVEAIKYLLEETKSSKILLENSASKNKIGSLEDLSEILKRVDSPRLGICLDSAHLFEFGFDLRQETTVSDLVYQLESLGLLEKLHCLHINDSKTDLSSQHDQHANLGDGLLGIEGVSNLVNHPKLKHLPLILEVPGIEGEGPDLENISRLSKILK